MSSARTRIERDFDPEAVRQLKATADRDISVGGPDLAAQAIGAGLVDEFHLFLAPVVVGGGNAGAPRRRPPASSSCWTSAASATAWSTSTTARGHKALIEDLDRVTVRELVRAADPLAVEPR